jgi:hypothetical protein
MGGKEESKDGREGGERGWERRRRARMGGGRIRRMGEGWGWKITTV